MRALVTGGAGFIGSGLVRALLDRGWEVTVLDDLSTGSAQKLEGVDARVVEGDIRDPAAVADASEGAEVVYHLAALGSVARSVDDPATSNDVNVNGTLRVLLGARDAGVRTVVYASSSSVYGDTPTLPKHEEMPVSPRSPYAASKLAGEAYARAFAPSFGLRTIALRFFNVFGPRQDPDSQYAAVIPRFITRMLDGQPPVINGDGRQSRDFTYLDNVTDACIRASEAGPDASGRAFNIGRGDRLSLLDLVERMNEVLGTDLEPVFTDPRPGDVRDSQADITAARDAFGYDPAIDVTEGLSRTVAWFRENVAIRP